MTKKALVQSCARFARAKAGVWFIFHAVARKMNHLSPFFASEASKKALFFDDTFFVMY
jgi:hypothetical protein